MLEAANRSSVMAANISSGNIGEDARNDIAWRKDWVARLTEAEQFFDNLFKTNSLPYTLFYSTKIIPGNIDYKTETQTLSINTNLHAPGAWVWLSSVEKSLQAVYDGLDATKRKRDWKLDSWPWGRVTDLRPFDKKRKIFSISVELLNSHGTVIGRTNFQSEGSWGFNGYGRPQIYVSDDDRKQVKFASVKADDITDNLTIRITSVNGTDANAAAKTGVLQVKAISEAEWNSYVLFRMGKNGIIGYNGRGSEVVIPDSLWNEPVTSIGDGAFKYRGITSITIGKNIEVHENAFDNKFSEFYNSNYGYNRWLSRRAGTYIYNYNNTKGWTSFLSEAVATEAAAEAEAAYKEETARGNAAEAAYNAAKEAKKVGAYKVAIIEDRKAEKKAFVEAERNSWHMMPFLGLGGAFFMGSIDFPYSGGGGLISFGSEFFYGGIDFFRIGFNIDLGLISVNGIKEKHPDVISDSTSVAALFKTSAFARLYPVNAWYLSGGAGMGYYGDYYSETKNGDEISESGTWAPVFSVGTGLVSSGGMSIDARYNILPHKSDAWYVTVNITFTGRAFSNLPP
jgi:hypothetical protein